MTQVASLRRGRSRETKCFATRADFFGHKAVCLNLSAALPNVFTIKILPFYLTLLILEVNLHYLKAKTIKK
jgi:hypothetical protein